MVLLHRESRMATTTSAREPGMGTHVDPEMEGYCHRIAV
jgi:hypothetical protein